MQTALSLRAAASHKGHATSCWSTEVRGEADDSSRGHVHAAEAAAPHQRHLSFVHTWKKTLLVFSSNLAYHILCTTLMMPVVFFFFQSVEILIIGRLRKRAINISSAATGWGGRAGGEVATCTSEAADGGRRSLWTVVCQPTSVSCSG